MKACLTQRLAVASVATALFLATYSPSFAQTHHQHAANRTHAQAQLTQGGQGAFTALAEAVARLESDPNTDWQSVNVGALRDHLVDMNLLMLQSEAQSTQIEGGLRISISATGRAIDAIHRMVPAHAGQLAKARGWQTTTERTATGATWLITARTPADMSKIQALGFYGLMSLEQHHQAHHWAIIRGANPHHH